MADGHKKCVFERLSEITVEISKQRKNVRCSHAPEKQQSTEKYKPFIQEILDYTHEHISDPNLTLKWIVENHLFMNVAYVSRQFVLQTGTKFSAYLNNLRIEKAKQLLVNCDSEKIYTVAEQVGCGNNPQYFSHLFKKHTKMTPKEYIQNVSKKGACEAPERNEG